MMNGTQQPVRPEPGRDEPLSQMCTALYDAFLAAGAPEEKARKAAVAVVEMQDEGWKRRLQQELAALRLEMEKLRADLTGSLRVLPAMITLVIGGVAAQILKTLFT
jgi:hypothetical protein